MKNQFKKNKKEEMTFIHSFHYNNYFICVIQCIVQIKKSKFFIFLIT